MTGVCVLCNAVAMYTTPSWQLKPTVNNVNAAPLNTITVTNTATKRGMPIISE